MSEERVVKLDRYDDKPYKGPTSFTSPQALSEAIRAMHEGNLDASLWIYIGGDPEKVGYPVIPWLAVSTSRGMVAISAEPTRDHFYDLMGDPSASGKVPIVIGGQEGDYHRRLLVRVEQRRPPRWSSFGALRWTSRAGVGSPSLRLGHHNVGAFSLPSTTVQRLYSPMS